MTPATVLSLANEVEWQSAGNKNQNTRVCLIMEIPNHTKLGYVWGLQFHSILISQVHANMWLADLIHLCVYICQLTHAGVGHVRRSSCPMSNMLSSFYFKHCEKGNVCFHQQESVEVCRQDSGIPQKLGWTAAYPQVSAEFLPTRQRRLFLHDSPAADFH